MKIELYTHPNVEREIRRALHYPEGVKNLDDYSIYLKNFLYYQVCGHLHRRKKRLKPAATCEAAAVYIWENGMDTQDKEEANKWLQNKHATKPMIFIPKLN